MSTNHYKAGVVIRGQYIEDNLVQFGGRGTGITFMSPDPRTFVKQLPLATPDLLSDLYQLSFDDVLDYLDQLGSRLHLSDNAYLQEALEASCDTSALTRPLLVSTYESLPHFVTGKVAREMAENSIGIDYLEGWVGKTLMDGRNLLVRAFGARALHIIAGNSPFMAAITLMRNAITRGDAIIKSPSNDPFTALAIARTMIDMDPTHPITRHLSVAYWKGGDEEFERQLYAPKNIEKIIAWGGFASVKYVAKYIQPGLELISMDPKRSVSVIGPEGLENENTMREVALRLATDIGAVNQEGCVSTRVVYILAGTDAAGVAKVNALGKYTYEAMQGLPESLSTPCKEMDPELRSSVNAARMNDDFYNVIGGMRDEGAIIVSQMPRPVDFAARLNKRVANFVPVDRIDDVCDRLDSYVQTVAVYPEKLKLVLRDRLSLFGVQRFASLGYAANATFSGPQDALEPLRELCRWVISEDCDPAVTPPLWEAGGQYTFQSKKAA